MRIPYREFKEHLPNLSWNITDLAEKLSRAGHETEIVDNQLLDISLTANRKDCQDLNYLLYDLAGVYGLDFNSEDLKFEHKEPINISVEQINKLLGSDISLEDLKQLERLGFEVTDSSVAAPKFRDIETVADIAEEMVRILGFDKLNIQPLAKETSPESALYNKIVAIKSCLVQLGLSETITTSFTKDGIIEVNDPFSKQEPFLRPGLLDGLLRTLARNPYLKKTLFFEIGNVFTPNEVTKLGIIIAGFKNVEVWQQKISDILGLKVNFVEVDPAHGENSDVKQTRLCFFELPIEKITPISGERSKSLDLPIHKFQPISKYPPLSRDITIDGSTSTAEVLDKIKKLDNLLLLEEIDQFQNRFTYRLIFQKMEGSFKDEEIKKINSELLRFQIS